jgi:DNA-binding PadR family transcriptional regulator
MEEILRETKDYLTWLRKYVDIDIFSLMKEFFGEGYSLTNLVKEYGYGVMETIETKTGIPYYLVRNLKIAGNVKTKLVENDTRLIKQITAIADKFCKYLQCQFDKEKLHKLLKKDKKWFLQQNFKDLERLLSTMNIFVNYFQNSQVESVVAGNLIFLNKDLKPTRQKELLYRGLIGMLVKPNPKRVKVVVGKEKELTKPVKLEFGEEYLKRIKELDEPIYVELLGKSFEDVLMEKL